jgi:hypothetical protein
VNTAYALGHLGSAYLEKGDPERAIPPLAQAIEQLGKFHPGFRTTRSRFMASLSEAYLATDRIDEAEQRAIESLAVSSDVKFTYVVGLAERTLGKIARARGDLSRAATQFEKALATFTGMQARFSRADARRRGRVARAKQDDAGRRVTFRRPGGSSRHCTSPSITSEPGGWPAPGALNYSSNTARENPLTSRTRGGTTTSPQSITRGSSWPDVKARKHARQANRTRRAAGAYCVRLEPAELKRVRQKVGVKAGKAGVVVRVKLVGRKLFVTLTCRRDQEPARRNQDADAGRLCTFQRGLRLVSLVEPSFDAPR